MDADNELRGLIGSMEPVRVPGEFVFVSTETPIDRVPAFATVLEAEGLTHVLKRADAELLGLDYDFVAAWITLEVRSALHAVGLTAAVSSALSEAGISCNVLAGRFHDHLLVPILSADQALEILSRLTETA